MFITDILKKVASLVYNAAKAIKALFIEPKPTKKVGQHQGTELERVRSIPERFKNPQERPVWVKSLFEDYIRGYGKVKSIDALNQVIQETLDNQINRRAYGR